MIYVKLLTSTAKAPARSSEDAAGLDLFADEDAQVTALGPTLVSTGLAFELPEGHFGLVRERSSLAADGVFATAGIIDRDYRGEVKVVMNTMNLPYRISAGSRFAQLLVLPYSAEQVSVAPELSPTKRGTGGFGSTGNM